jgi:hypothetical protein
VTRPPDEVPSQVPILALMTLVLLWSSVLTVGFGYAAVAGSEQAGFARTAGYGALAAFTALLALRTAYEMVRKLRRPRQGS